MTEAENPKRIRSYRDLIVWHRAMGLSKSVYQLTSDWPSDERFGLTSQTRRSAVSIAANVAEGHGRYSRQEFARFVAIANGSLCELETLIELSTSFEYVSTQAAEPLMRECREIGNMLNALYRSLDRKSSNEST